MRIRLKEIRRNDRHVNHAVFVDGQRSGEVLLYPGEVDELIDVIRSRDPLELELEDNNGNVERVELREVR